MMLSAPSPGPTAVAIAIFGTDRLDVLVLPLFELAHAATSDSAARSDTTVLVRRSIVVIGGSPCRPDRKSTDPPRGGAGPAGDDGVATPQRFVIRGYVEADRGEHAATRGVDNDARLGTCVHDLAHGALDADVAGRRRRSGSHHAYLLGPHRERRVLAVNAECRVTGENVGRTNELGDKPRRR